MEQLRQHSLPVLGQTVESLVAAFLAPFAGEETLGLQPAKERVKRAFLDGQATVLEFLPQGVAVPFLAKREQYTERQGSAAKLDTQFIEQVIFDRHGHIPMCHTLCITQVTA